MWKETLLGCNKKSPIGGGATWSHIGLLENIERNEKKVKVLKSLYKYWEYGTINILIQVSPTKVGMTKDGSYGRDESQMGANVIGM